MSLSFSQYTGDQCSSYETFDTIAGNCQRLVINSNAVERWFTLKFEIRYYWYCSLCQLWCEYLASCRDQTRVWRKNCRRKFKDSVGHFYITTVPRGKDLPFLRIDVNLCKPILRYGGSYDKIFTINITEHKSGSTNIRNGLY